MARHTIQRKAYHVLAGDGIWEVRDDSNDRVLGTFETREDAIAVARDAVETQELAQLVFHNPDGSIASQWPSDEELEPTSMEVIDAGELALEAPEADESGYAEPGEEVWALRDEELDETEGDLE